MAKQNNRDQMIIATKFTTGYKPKDSPEKIKANFQGNHSKSLHVSLADSLKKLRTDYIDLLYVHWYVQPPTASQSALRGIDERCS